MRDEVEENDDGCFCASDDVCFAAPDEDGMDDGFDRPRGGDGAGDDEAVLDDDED
jgi:hypothetical protein